MVLAFMNIMGGTYIIRLDGKEYNNRTYDCTDNLRHLIIRDSAETEYWYEY